MSACIFYKKTQANENRYDFSGAKGSRVWPRSIGALGPGGVWNILWRAGYQVPDPTSDITVLSQCEVAFLHLSSPLSENESSALNDFLSSGKKAIVAGSPQALNSITALRGQVKKSENHHPLAPLIAGSDKIEEFYAPPETEVFTFKNDEVIVGGNLYAAIGERQNPKRAVRILIKDAPLAVKTGGLVALNGDPFAGYQALLQGHCSVLTWINWRHRMFWLDEHASYLMRLIRNIAPNFLREIPSVKVNLPETTIVYRHDLDNSRNRSFIDEEIKSHTPATHAVLLDRNRKYWTRILNSQHDHESAFHYNTGKEPSIIDILRSRLLNRVIPIRPEPKVICKGGLLRQVIKARKSGIGVHTLHRHLAFLYYPESIESLGAVFDSLEGEVLGACSFFRARVIRWGELAEIGEMPDSQFPSWYPFRLYDASINKLLKGWEMTAIMEPEPELFEQMINGSGASTFKKVITVIFHPAHASTNTFVNKGTINWFKNIQLLIKGKSIPAMTLRDVFKRCGAPWNHSKDD